jgi:hypothetical protein
VIVAFILVLLLGFAAIGIDVGSIYSDQQQLQNGADAGALAIAESCQRGSCVNTADKYAKANKLDGQATGTMLSNTAGTVTVQTSSTHQNWFAGVLGMPTSALSARASATWGYPSGGAVMPLAFSWCAFQQATGNWYDQGLPLPDTPTVITIIEHSCTPPAHNEVPGGFGELQGTSCVATVLAGGWVASDSGNNGPNSCSGFDWSTVMNTTVLIPIFDDVKGTGSNAQYKIKGLAAFEISAICLGPSAKMPTNLSQCPSAKRIEGKFTNYTSLSGGYTIDPNAPHFGAGVVNLSS